MDTETAMNRKPTSILSPADLPGSDSPSHYFTRYDPDPGVFWCILDPKGRPCFHVELLEELMAFADGMKALGAGTRPAELPFRYFVFASKTPGVFNFGGDLDLFLRCVRSGDTASLRDYARLCIRVVHSYFVSFHLPITTISLVQGNALGGGFEAVLAGDVVIAEKSALFGFPEVLFNLFPGMGAYHFLARRIGMSRTEQMILGGKTYRAEEMLEEGLVDRVAPDGKGEEVLFDYIEKHSRKRSVHESIFQLRRNTFPVRLEEMLEVSDSWTETAMRVGPRELRLMERLVNSQEQFSRKNATMAPAGFPHRV